jgi:sugar-phosphatase
MITIDCRGILFDCDGVLVDSLESAGRAWTIWSSTWAPQFDFHRDIVHGQRAGETIARLVAADDVAVAEAELAALELEHVEGTLEIPGAAALMAALPGGRWTVVTSGLRELATRRLTAAGLIRPEAFVAAEDVTRGKPDPEPYRRGAEVLGLDPADCVVFEDAPAGIASARAAGIGHVVGVGAASREGAPDVVIADLRSASWVDGRLVLEAA